MGGSHSTQRPSSAAAPKGTKVPLLSTTRPALAWPHPQLPLQLADVACRLCSVLQRAQLADLPLQLAVALLERLPSAHMQLEAAAPGARFENAMGGASNRSQ